MLLLDLDVPLLPPLMGAGGLEEIEDGTEHGHERLREIEKRTGFETRAVVLGHIQRGGSPTAFDRVLATRYGLGDIDMVHRGEFGCMAALKANKIVSITLKEAIAKNRVVDNEMIDIASGLFEEIGETANK